VSANILTELVNTLSDPYFRRRLTTEQIEAAQRLLEEEATRTPLRTRVSRVATYAEDDVVLAAAVSAGVDYLVTGDKQLQRLGIYQSIGILSPRAFLDLLELDAADES
jgi:putative PIN family toxin of toxin-antitoxin system